MLSPFTITVPLLVARYGLSNRIKQVVREAFHFRTPGYRTSANRR